MNEVTIKKLSGSELTILKSLVDQEYDRRIDEARVDVSISFFDWHKYPLTREEQNMAIAGTVVLPAKLPEYGNKILAIKMYRDRLNFVENIYCGLTDAQNIVEAFLASSLICNSCHHNFGSNKLIKKGDMCNRICSFKDEYMPFTRNFFCEGKA